MLACKMQEECPDMFDELLTWVEGNGTSREKEVALSGYLHDLSRPLRFWVEFFYFVPRNQTFWRMPELQPNLSVVLH